jgi:septum formation protein
MRRLLLASKSASRKMLLDESRINYQIIEQSADEALCDWSLPIEEVVSSIAVFKMEHAIIPVDYEQDHAYVLTADTLDQSLDGTINGKPLNRADAIDKIKRARAGSRLCTAFCLDKKILKNGVWHTHQRILKVVSAEYQFSIPDDWIETYLDNSIALQAAGAITIEGFWAQFLRTVHGSYSGIVGLPMYEVREALQELGFFE